MPGFFKWENCNSFFIAFNRPTVWILYPPKVLHKKLFGYEITLVKEFVAGCLILNEWKAWFFYKEIDENVWQIFSTRKSMKMSGKYFLQENRWKCLANKRLYHSKESVVWFIFKSRLEKSTSVVVNTWEARKILVIQWHKL